MPIFLPSSPLRFRNRPLGSSNFQFTQSEHFGAASFGARPVLKCTSKFFFNFKVFYDCVSIFMGVVYHLR